MTIKSAFAVIFLYFFVGFVGFEGVFNYGFDSPEGWYARSGALLTLIALYCELRVLPEAEQLANKYSNNNSKFSLKSIKFMIHFSVVHGTLVWSYGDIYYLWLKKHYNYSVLDSIISLF